eukprot:3847914-Pleurochrysis_carterae.AAC.2
MKKRGYVIRPVVSTSGTCRLPVRICLSSPSTRTSTSSFIFNCGTESSFRQTCIRSTAQTSQHLNRCQDCRGTERVRIQITTCGLLRSSPREIDPPLPRKQMNA